VGGGGDRASARDREKIKKQKKQKKINQPSRRTIVD